MIGVICMYRQACSACGNTTYFHHLDYDMICDMYIKYAWFVKMQNLTLITYKY